MSRFREVTGERVHWRVVVRSTGKAEQSTAAPVLAWHLVPCTEPRLASAHCAEGQRLMAHASDPDGHCLVDGACPRCRTDSAARA